MPPTKWVDDAETKTARVCRPTGDARRGSIRALVRSAWSMTRCAEALQSSIARGAATVISPQKRPPTPRHRHPEAQASSSRDSPEVPTKPRAAQRFQIWVMRAIPAASRYVKPHEIPRKSGRPRRPVLGPFGGRFRRVLGERWRSGTPEPSPDTPRSPRSTVTPGPESIATRFACCHPRSSGHSLGSGCR
jgi:hypothetical protein